MVNDKQNLIMIVDDNPTNAKVLFEFLQASGFRVLVAKSGESALEKLQVVSPDLILLDVMMPGIDGFETCRRLKENKATQDIPVIFMTALSDVVDKVKGLTLGAVDYITKPFQPEDVRARINLHLKLCQLNQKLEQRAAELTATVEQLKQSQQRLVQSEKMSSLGQLVAGIAHEINNPTSFVQGNLTYAQKYMQDLIDHIHLYKNQASATEIAQHAAKIDFEYLLKDFPHILHSMQEGIERIGDISNSLRTFARADNMVKIPFNIHDGIDSTILILKHRLKASNTHPAIEIIRDYDDLPEVECFPGQLNQVFMNLLTNAIDALEESNVGRSYKEIIANPNFIKIKTKLNEDENNILIMIKDNGLGIPEEIKSQIFDHLFTTKVVGKGTGLGLAITQQIIVEKHGGSIEVNSIPGEGAEFVITLPIDDEFR
ncbi:response regulator receiver sensor signal transduction histidine kinase [Calothrix sp. NIES-2100]|uniref:sensor histidine kinase n=1 Tax=Calothrix sp. NIES-2100 TaxID=1954172 RepID=UPI000B5F16DD|nr:response regulator receiver sensor signal transduction histidine kinase [Calothrix sp. NIES-2100]